MSETDIVPSLAEAQQAVQFAHNRMVKALSDVEIAQDALAFAARYFLAANEALETALKREREASK